MMNQNTEVNHQSSYISRMIILRLYSNNCVGFLFIKSLSRQSANTSSHSFCLPVPQHVTSRPSLASLRMGEMCALCATIKNTHLLPPFPAPLSLGCCRTFRGGRDTWPSSRTVWSRPQRTPLWQVLWRMIIQLENQTKQMHTLAVRD